MKNLNEILFFIQARTNSERVPAKMTRSFAGTNLFEIALEKIKQTKIPQQNFIASVHEQSLIDLTKKHGFNVYHRSEASRNEEQDVRIMYEFHDQYPQYKYAVKINACNIFLKPNTIDAFIDQYINSPHDGLFSVVGKKSYFWNEQGELITNWPDGYNMMNTKYVEKTYEGAYCLFAGSIDLLSQGKWMGNPPFSKNDPELFEVDSFEALDIDHEWEFDLYTTHWQHLHNQNQ